MHGCVNRWVIARLPNKSPPTKQGDEILTCGGLDSKVVLKQKV